MGLPAAGAVWAEEPAGAALDRAAVVWVGVVVAAVPDRGDAVWEVAVASGASPGHRLEQSTCIHAL